jgi:CRP/FNR family nitrogen fixation transcriptional regulator
MELAMSYAKVALFPQKRRPDDAAGQKHTRLTVHASEIITPQDQLSPDCHKIITGSVRLVRSMSDGSRIIGQFLFPGDLFGFEVGDRSYFAAEAINRTVLIRYPRNMIEDLTAQNLSVARQLCDVSSRRLRNAYSHMVMIGRQSSAERIASFLLEMLERNHAATSGLFLELPMGQRDIADYLCLRFETVCREMRRLRSDGVIEFGARRLLIIRNKLALSEICRETFSSSNFTDNDSLWDRGSIENRIAL